MNLCTGWIFYYDEVQGYIRGPLKNITYDVINQDKLNEINPQLSVSEVVLDKSEVVVKGSEDTLNKIATVKALIDLNNPKFTQKDTYTLENLPIVRN